MGQYIAKRDFISPELGNVRQGQKLELSDSRSKNWLGAGLVEPALETKPAPAEAKVETKPALKKGRVNAKRSKSADSESASEG